MMDGSRSEIVRVGLCLCCERSWLGLPRSQPREMEQFAEPMQLCARPRGTTSRSLAQAAPQLNRGGQHSPSSSCQPLRFLIFFVDTARALRYLANSGAFSPGANELSPSTNTRQRQDLCVEFLSGPLPCPYSSLPRLPAAPRHPPKNRPKKGLPQRFPRAEKLRGAGRCDLCVRHRR